jgi:NADPH-dependent F420 reductase
MSDPARPVVAILGGTGAEGRGLGLRWAAAGYAVVLGSRDAARAEAVARELAASLEGRDGAVAPSGADNRTAAERADVVVLAVPYAAQASTLDAVREALAGKVLVDVAVPLRPPEVATVRLPVAGSAAAEAQAQLGDGVRVVAAFQNVAAGKLADLGAAVDCDVLVTGDDAHAKRQTLDLAAAAGLRAFDAGPLANAGVVDGLTAILVGLNRRYGARNAGIRITNLPAGAGDRG